MESDLTALPVFEIPKRIHDQINDRVMTLLRLCGVTWMYSMEHWCWMLRLNDPVRGLYIDCAVDYETMDNLEAMTHVVQNLYVQLGAAR